MKKELKVTLLSLIASIVIVGCGGGGSTIESGSTDKPTPTTSKKLTGYYIDSAIIGASYNCETTNGVTNSSGKFEFENGHGCKFYLNKKLLRSVESSKLFDGVYILEDNNKTASVLQTMDLDGNASNGIQILPDATQCLDASIDDVNNSALKVCLENNVTNYSGHEVNETEAREHIEQTIEQNRPTATDSNATTNEDTAKNITLSGSDLQGDTLSFIITQQPSHGALDKNETSGAIIYTPNLNFNGSDSFKFKASDGTFESDEATVNITVNPTNDAPAATDDTASVNEDSNVLIDVLSNDSDEENNTLTISTVSNPSNGTAVVESGKIRYTPNANYNGNDSFGYTISDGNGGTAAATVNVTITPVNDTPTATEQNITTDEDINKSITLTGNDIDGDNLNYTVTQQPTHGTLSGTAPNIIYTPDLNFNGSDNFKFKVNDGTLDSAVATVNITVNPVNDAPSANEQNITTAEDNNKSITLTGSDIDSATLNYSVVQQPTHGVLSGTAPNLTYIPNRNFNGNDSFTFKVNDGSLDSAEANISITITAVNDVPTATDINTSTDENTPKDITLLGSDIDSSTLSYAVTQNPANGNVTINGNVATYTPNDGYSGNDSFKYRANDGSLDSNEATVSINIIQTNIHITDNYKVIPLGSNTTVSKKIYLDSGAKNLYLVLSNDNNSSSSNASVSHNAKVSTKKLTTKVSTVSNVPKIIKDTKEALEFSKEIQNFLKTIKNSKRELNRVVPSYNASEGDSHTFFLDWDGDYTIDATLKKIVSNVNTSYGDKTLYVWVANNAFEGANCDRSKCVNQDMVNTLADKFLKNGSNNDIYDWVTNIYGEEWGPTGNNNLIAESNRVDILLMDIFDDDSENGGVVGYFYGKDNIVKGDGSNEDPRPAGSNERVMFYIDSVMYANRDTNPSDYWEKEIYSTLAHEFQHMINFYQKGVLEQASTETWLNEMMSVTTEDLVATKIATEGVRGVASNDGSAGSSNNNHGRFPLFNQNNDITLTNWNGTLKDYSKASSFGTFLVRNYGGAELMNNMMHNDKGDEQAVIEAIKATTGEDVTFTELLQKWGIGVMLSNFSNLSSDLPKYNFGDFLTLDYNGISYDMGSINFFNYSEEPKLHTTVDSINPHANYYYKIGENITSASVDLNITLDADTTATLIAK